MSGPTPRPMPDLFHKGPSVSLVKGAGSYTDQKLKLQQKKAKVLAGIGVLLVVVGAWMFVQHSLEHQLVLSNGRAGTYTQTGCVTWDPPDSDSDTTTTCSGTFRSSDGSMRKTRLPIAPGEGAESMDRGQSVPARAETESFGAVSVVRADDAGRSSVHLYGIACGALAGAGLALVGLGALQVFPRDGRDTGRGHRVTRRVLRWCTGGGLLAYAALWTWAGLLV